MLEGTAEEAQPDTAAIAAYAEKYGWRPPPGQCWYVVRPANCYAADEETYPASAAVFNLVEEA